MFEEAIQNVHGIAACPGDDNAMEARELVRGEIVIGHAAIGVEVLAIRPSINGADRNNKTQPIRGRDVAAAPGLRQGQGRLGIDAAGRGVSTPPG